MATSPISIDRALTDKRLLGAAFPELGSWAVWLAVLKAAFGLKLTDEELAIFASVAGGRAPPTHRVREFWAVVGRRGGKSRVAAALAVYLALFTKHKLSPGEIGTVLVLSASLDQSKAVFEYTRGLLEASPALRREIADSTRQEIRLKNGIVIATHSNSFRRVRGRTLCAAVFDEVSFWRDEQSAQPDREVYTAVLPSLLTTNGLLVGISSPYRKVGLLHAKHKQYFGATDDDVLVVQGSSQCFNPTLSADDIAAQRAADPTAAASEWDASFRSDLASFLDAELIESCVNRARPLEIPPHHDFTYRAFVDVSSGAIGGDAYAIAIGHREQGIYVIDCVRHKFGPFDPASLTKEYADLLREYHVDTVYGDKYAGEWPPSAWGKAGISYMHSELTASELYLECLPCFTRGLVSLPPHDALLRELQLLERSPGRVGRDVVAHPRNAHDDCANALAGVLYQLAKPQLDYSSMADGYGDEIDPFYEKPPSRHPAPMTVGEYMDRLQGYVFQYSGGRCWR